MTKMRAEGTTSERELLLALAARGLNVTLATIALWRKKGLLPALAGRGQGKGKGRLYCWQEPDIVSRAAYVHEIVNQAAQEDHAVLVLWLCGYSIPISVVRRAWKLRGSNQSQLALKESKNTHNAPKTSRGPQKRRVSPDLIILDVLLALGDGFNPQPSFPHNHVIREVVAIIIERMGLAYEPATLLLPDGLATIAGTVLMAVERSNLLSRADDDDFVAAHTLFGLTARFIATVTNDGRGDPNLRPPFWCPDLAQTLGPPLFLCILTFLKSGHRQNVETIAHALGRVADEIQVNARTTCSSVKVEKILKALPARLGPLWNELT